MADTTSTDTASAAGTSASTDKKAAEVNNLFHVALKLFEQESSDEMMEIKKAILRRVALESDIKPSRIPTPLNITEIGGLSTL